MNKQEAKKKIQEIQQKQEIENFESNFNRSRSITVGTSFGGTTEISMRGNGDRFLYSIMQPVEVVELIHQLAANIGCHIAIKPRDDFSSWREWRIPDSEQKHLNNHAPHVNDMAVFQRLGAIGFDQQQAEKEMEKWLKKKEYDYATQVKKGLTNETVATKKPKNGRKFKRPAASA